MVVVGMMQGEKRKEEANLLGLRWTPKIGPVVEL